MADPLRKLTQFCLYLAGDQVMREMHLVAGLTMRRLAIQGFQSQSDPYGKPWKPNLRGGQILRNRGRLIASIQRLPRATPSEVEIGSNVVYARVHQKGAVIRPVTAKALAFKLGNKQVFARKVVIPQRMFIPDEKKGLPDRWNLEVKADLNRALAQKGIRP